MQFRRARKFLKRLMVTCLAVAGLFGLAVAVFAIHCSTVRGHFQPSPHTSADTEIPGYARPEDDTFLTYAEWYIVWSYNEKAAWQQTKLPSGFPYFGAIEQYWSGYCCSYGVVRGKYPFNLGDHLMLTVIGTSFTVEYFLKGAYENTIGRLTEWLAGHQLTEEDRYASLVASNYGAFVKDRPFYEFSFAGAFRGLWSDTRLLGPHLVRKWERKAWLSLDYGVEAIYCGLIQMASHATYGVEDDVTYALVENAPESLFGSIPAVQKVKAENGGRCIVKMPRYQKFTDAAVKLLATPARFETIAGNRQIMVTAVVPRSWSFQMPAGELLFSLDILTDPSAKRVALRIPVVNLDEVVPAMTIEHFYDY
ncbi:MAG: hypothetical protein WA324_19640 [Bryobacteraceae bacterium]